MAERGDGATPKSASGGRTDVGDQLSLAGGPNRQTVVCSAGRQR